MDIDLKALAAIGGLGLGLWNLLAPKWSGVTVEIFKASFVRIVNSRARPAFIDRIGWAAAPSWEPKIMMKGLAKELEAWRSTTYPTTLRADIELAYAKGEGEPATAVFVCLEDGAVFTTLPWYAWRAGLLLRRQLRKL